MPIGVYERQPYMKNYGKTNGKRELVLQLAQQGKSNLEIARILDVDPRTVKRLKRPVLDWGNKR